MEIHCTYGGTGTQRRLLQWSVAWAVMVIFAWPGLIGDAPAYAANPVESVQSWVDHILERSGIRRGQAPEPTTKPVPPPSFPKVLRLTLDDAMALFMKQNLDLIIGSYGIDAAKGREITARLYPNPTLSVSTLSAYTQGCNLNTCGAVAPSLTQLFEVAGRRGYRTEAAALDTMSLEAKLEDTVRQMGFTLKETYFRVQRQRGHLAVDQEIQGVLIKLLQGSTGEGKRGGSDLDRVRLGLLAVNADAEVLRDLQRIEEVSGDLRMMLRIPPEVELELDTNLVYQLVEPNFARLLEYALENRPDIRSKRLTRDKRKTELHLAKAIRYPNVTTNLGYSVQGPHGPDNQQQWALSLSVPLPVFNRNQGGLVEAEVAVMSVEADIEKTAIQIQNEVAVAYRKFLHGRKLVDAMNGALAQASTLFGAAQQAFAKKEIGIVDLENTRRSYADTEESYLEAIFGYQQNWLRLEWAAGRDIAL
jgi:cobalt-zinc-cadmium efflux system outer membrane protein